MVLSIAIAQTQIEQIKRPIITVLTTQWAFQNSVNRERFEEVSGSTDCATSAGVIGTSFPLNPVPSGEPARRKSEITERARRSRPRAKPKVECLAKFVCPVHRRLRNPSETWPNLGADAGLLHHNGGDYGYR